MSEGKKPMAETAMKRLEEYKTKGAHLLIPEMRFEGLSPFHAPVVESVTASLNPADGDIYVHEKGKSWRLTGLFLQKLSVCAGIRWKTEDTRRTDNRADREYVSYQAVGFIVKPDGSEVGMKGEYDLDMEVIREEIEESYAKKTRDYYEKQEWFQKKSPPQQKDYINECIRRDVLLKRKHKLKLAETGAKCRAIRALLGLKNYYTTEELKKPFVMVRIVARPDYNDPEVKKAMLAATIKSITGIYHEPAIDADFTTADIQQPAGTWPEPTEPPATPPAAEPKPEPKADPKKSKGKGKAEPKAEEPNIPEDPQLVDFRNADPETQVHSIEVLAGRKNYNLEKKLPMKPIDMQPHTRERLFKTLLGLPDAATTPEPVADGIPA